MGCCHTLLSHGTWVNKYLPESTPAVSSAKHSVPYDGVIDTQQHWWFVMLV